MCCSVASTRCLFFYLFYLPSDNVQGVIFIQNEKADIIHRIPPTSSNQFSFPACTHLHPHHLPFLFSCQVHMLLSRTAGTNYTRQVYSYQYEHEHVAIFPSMRVLQAHYSFFVLIVFFVRSLLLLPVKKKVGTAWLCSLSVLFGFRFFEVPCFYPDHKTACTNQVSGTKHILLLLL